MPGPQALSDGALVDTYIRGALSIRPPVRSAQERSSQSLTVNSMWCPPSGSGRSRTRPSLLARTRKCRLRYSSGSSQLGSRMAMTLSYRSTRVACVASGLLVHSRIMPDRLRRRMVEALAACASSGEG